MILEFIFFLFLFLISRVNDNTKPILATRTCYAPKTSAHGAIGLTELAHAFATPHQLKGRVES